jgi:hypothetical protein
MQGDLIGDIVTPEWLERHAIAIPRASGVFQSPTGWVRVDSHGTIVAAGESDERVIAWLVARGILDNADIDYAIAYVTCRDAHRSYRKERGYKSCLHIDVLGSSSSLSCEQTAEVYSLMCRELGQKYCRIIEYAWDTVRTPETPPNYEPPYRKAFSALAHAFRAAVKQVMEDSAAD